MYNFVFITDSGFFLPTKVAISSLIDAIGNESATIYCLQKRLESFQISELKALMTDIVKIEIKDVEEFDSSSNLDIAKQYCAANKTALVKFDLADILSDIDRVVYMDGDIIVKNNIIDIFDTDISDSYAAVVADTGIIYNKTIRSKYADKYYFNSGVMLLNLKKIREDSMREKLYIEKMNSADKSLMDQNVFNNIFGDKVVRLPLKYNCQFVNINRARYWHNLELPQINSLYMTNYKDWDDISNDAIVIHYASFDKPWKYSDVINVELWETYARKCGINLKSLKRKKLHADFLYKLSRYKLMKYPVNFIWEWETVGIKKAIIDISKVFKRK